MSFSENATVTGGVVFAGYGLVVPESQDFGYDSYATLDVEDKIVLVLRYFPEEMDQESRSKLARYSGLRYKALQARERGRRFRQRRNGCHAAIQPPPSTRSPS